jgi:hypothetical protein
MTPEDAARRLGREHGGNTVRLFGDLDGSGPGG